MLTDFSWNSAVINQVKRRPDQFDCCGLHGNAWSTFFARKKVLHTKSTEVNRGDRHVSNSSLCRYKVSQHWAREHCVFPALYKSLLESNGRGAFLRTNGVLYAAPWIHIGEDASSGKNLQRLKQQGIYQEPLGCAQSIGPHHDRVGMEMW